MIDKGFDVLEIDKQNQEIGHYVKPSSIIIITNY